MGQTPAKSFLPPTPYGQSPDSNVLMQAQAPPQAPRQNFIPLNQPDPQTQQASTQPAQIGMTGTRDRINNIFNMRPQMGGYRNMGIGGLLD